MIIITYLYLFWISIENIQLVPNLFVAVTVSVEETLRRNPLLSSKVDWVQEDNDLFEHFYNTYKGSKERLETTSLSKKEVVSSAIKIISNNFPQLNINSKSTNDIEVDI